MFCGPKLTSCECLWLYVITVDFFICSFLKSIILLTLKILSSLMNWICWMRYLNSKSTRNNIILFYSIKVYVLLWAVAWHLLILLKKILTYKKRMNKSDMCKSNSYLCSKININYFSTPITPPINWPLYNRKNKNKQK